MGAWYVLFQCDFVLFVCMVTFLKPQGEENISWGGGVTYAWGRIKYSPGISGHGIHTAGVDSSCMITVPLPRLLAHAHWWDLLFWHCYRQVLHLSHQGRRHDNRQRYVKRYPSASSNTTAYTPFSAAKQASAVSSSQG